MVPVNLLLDLLFKILQEQTTVRNKAVHFSETPASLFSHCSSVTASETSPASSRLCHGLSLWTWSCEGLVAQFGVENGKSWGQPRTLQEQNTERNSTGELQLQMNQKKTNQTKERHVKPGAGKPRVKMWQPLVIHLWIKRISQAPQQYGFHVGPVHNQHDLLSCLPSSVLFSHCLLWLLSVL